ncbi:MAG: glycosyltransferase family 2 protein [Bryobacterales bacterium]|nr:glycosyltransferase family 2 protein [Bryobacteraceae bacterium]MDW8355697.1 glycosyltransferase family 2 protein [Bryobacterales bacterium]
MHEPGRAKAALIIPALNEEEALPHTLAQVPPGLFSAVIVADNGSTDGTAEVARRSGAIVVCEPRRGYGAACQRGLAAVPPDVHAVVFLQADGSEDPREAARLLEPIFRGEADLVVGSRTCQASCRLRFHQAWGNRLAVWLIRILHGGRYTDLGPFRAVRLDALRQLRLRDRGYGWTVEMQVRALQEGLRILEVPVASRRRTAGRDKISGTFTGSLKAGFKILWTILRLALPRRVASPSGSAPRPRSAPPPS